MSEAKLYVITGPSASGKSTFVNTALDSFQSLQKVVTYTTRQPRESEIDGVSYHFLTEDRFAKMERSGAFCDSREIFGNFYGLRTADILRFYEEGVDQILDLDTAGALVVAKRFSFATTIFLAPPSSEILEKRLRQRGTDEREVQMRLDRARSDLGLASDFDHRVCLTDLSEIVPSFASIAEGYS